MNLKTSLQNNHCNLFLLPYHKKSEALFPEKNRKLCFVEYESIVSAVGLQVYARENTL